MLFIDQPVGTGNSWAQDYNAFVTDMKQVSEQFYFALQQLATDPIQTNCSFFANYFNGKSKKAPVYITGESFAGKYIPNMASYILEQNQSPNPPANKLSLEGIAFGDGFTEPVTIATEYGAFAFNLGLIDYEERIEVERTLMQLMVTSQNGKWNKTSDIWNYVVNDIIEKGGNFYTYDMFEYAPPVDFNNAVTFFNQPGFSHCHSIIVLCNQVSPTFITFGPAFRFPASQTKFTTNYIGI